MVARSVNQNHVIQLAKLFYFPVTPSILITAFSYQFVVCLNICLILWREWKRSSLSYYFNQLIKTLHIRWSTWIWFIRTNIRIEMRIPFTQNWTKLPTFTNIWFANWRWNSYFYWFVIANLIYWDMLNDYEAGDCAYSIEVRLYHNASYIMRNVLLLYCIQVMWREEYCNQLRNRNLVSCSF